MQTAKKTKQEIIDGLDALSQEDLERVLAFMCALTQTAQRAPGIPAQEFIDFFKQFPPFTQEEVDQITAIFDEIEREGKRTRER